MAENDLVDSAAQPDGNSQQIVERVLEMYHAYRTGHVFLGMNARQYREFGRLAGRLEQEPGFNELYEHYKHEHGRAVDRYLHEIIIDRHGHVGPRWPVHDRDLREQHASQLHTLTKAGPAGLLAMMLTYARTGDVDAAIESARRVAPFDRMGEALYDPRKD